MFVKDNPAIIFVFIFAEYIKMCDVIELETTLEANNVWKVVTQYGDEAYNILFDDKDFQLFQANGEL
jgi:hypothetical protein